MLAGVLVILGGYLLGSAPFGYWVVRIFQDEDIRTKGSGNIGATNVWRVYGRWLGVPVILLDVAKGFVPASSGCRSRVSCWRCSPARPRWSGHWRPLYLRLAEGRQDSRDRRRGDVGGRTARGRVLCRHVDRGVPPLPLLVGRIDRHCAHPARVSIWVVRRRLAGDHVRRAGRGRRCCCCTRRTSGGSSRGPKVASSSEKRYGSEAARAAGRAHGRGTLGDVRSGSGSPYVVAVVIVVWHARHRRQAAAGQSRRAGARDLRHRVGRRRSTLERDRDADADRCRDHRRVVAGPGSDAHTAVRHARLRLRPAARHLAREADLHSRRASAAQQPFQPHHLGAQRSRLLIRRDEVHRLLRRPRRRLERLRRGRGVGPGEGRRDRVRQRLWRATDALSSRRTSCSIRSAPCPLRGRHTHAPATTAIRATRSSTFSTRTRTGHRSPA